MATHATATKKQNRPTGVLATNAGDLPLDRAANEAVCWWDEYSMLDDLDLGNDLDAVLQVAQSLGLDTLAGLHHGAAKVIAGVVGIADITKFTTATAANSLHRTRNSVSALLFAAEVRYGANRRGPYEVIETLPAIAPRHGGKRRPLHDDEVLLTRSAAVYTLRCGGRSVPVASQYALAESGAYPMETTSVEPIDFDSVTTPTTVSLPGVHTWSNERQVRLTPFAARLITESLDRHLAAGGSAVTWRLCYRGEGTKGSASASSSNNLKNLTKKVGITHPVLEGSATTRWRIHKELEDKGGIAALGLMGKVQMTENGPNYRVSKVYEFLNLPTQSSPSFGDDDFEDDDFADF